ncbi:MAG: adenylate kinase [Pseudomonadota bacterium]|nr:adenylate kinase [Pseudomonadota bacterium]
MNVLLFGPPGSGKGTQAKDLAAALGVPHVATGDIFRRHLKEGTELGLRAKGYMQGGGLVPDDFTCEIVASRLEEPDAGAGVLLDGFPRTAAQAEWLVRWLAKRGQRVDALVNLVVPDEVILERITGRRSCPSCGATFHVVFAPPADGRCTRCGAAVIQRDDDKDSVVANRLLTYARETVPVLPVLRPVTTIHEIPATGDVAEIRARVFAALGLS